MRTTSTQAPHTAQEDASSTHRQPETACAERRRHQGPGGRSAVGLRPSLDPAASSSCPSIGSRVRRRGRPTLLTGPAPSGMTCASVNSRIPHHHGVFANFGSTCVCRWSRRRVRRIVRPARCTASPLAAPHSEARRHARADPLAGRDRDGPRYLRPRRRRRRPLRPRRQPRLPRGVLGRRGDQRLDPPDVAGPGIVDIAQPTPLLRASSASSAVPMNGRGPAERQLAPAPIREPGLPPLPR